MGILPGEELASDCPVNGLRDVVEFAGDTAKLISIQDSGGVEAVVEEEANFFH